MINYQGKYLYYVSNLGVNLPSCDLREFWILTSCPFQAKVSSPSNWR